MGSVPRGSAGADYRSLGADRPQREQWAHRESRDGPKGGTSEDAPAREHIEDGAR
jgi:hypothetical protein